jgi:hypothetical protein
MLMLLTMCLGAAELPSDYDAFLASPRRLGLEEHQTQAGREVLSRSHVTHVEERFGVPTVLWAERVPGARSPRDIGLTAREAARHHLARHAPAYRLPLRVVAELAIDRTHDMGRGAVVVSFARRVGELPVLRERLHVVMTQQLELVAITGHLSPLADVPAHFNLTAETALALAAQELSGASPEAPTLRLTHQLPGGWQRHATGGAFSEPPRARRAIYASADGLVPAWHLEVSAQLGGTAAQYAFVISAKDGALLSRLNLTRSAGHAYRAWVQPLAPFAPLEGPTGDVGSPHPTGTPSGYSPAVIPPNLVTLDHAGISTGDPWLPAGATHLEGNNALAYADLYPPDGLNQPDAGLPLLADGGVLDGGFDDAGAPWRERADLRVPLSGPGAFDWTYDVTQPLDASDTQRFASATHAFYVANWLHDVFYDLGFTEANGNAQADNLGRGGLGGDPLLIEVHDTSELNNANAMTPADGASPRLQFFRYLANRPSRVVVSSPAALAAAHGAPPIGPAEAVWNVTADVAVPISQDGGMSGCDDWLNREQLAGTIVLVNSTGCGPGPSMERAADAGVAGVIFSGSFSLTPPGAPLWPPAHGMVPANVTALRNAVAAGETVTVTLDRPDAVSRDPALDTGTVVHEWAHYLTNRRLGGEGLALFNTAARGLAEGWSDFVALWALLRASDTQVAGNATWGGTYTSGGGWSLDGALFDGSSNNAWLFGDRRYPVSTNLARNPLTYRHVADGQALPDRQLVPRSPILPLTPNSAYHNAGELCVAALWEAQAALLNSPRFTFDAARARMAEYLMASLAATPALPTFLEARDAMLAVVAATSRDEDLPLFMSAFARRGLGPLAQAPDRRSTTNGPLREDFSTDVGHYKRVRLEVDDAPGGCDDDGVLDSEEEGTVTIRLMNIGTRRLTASTLTLSSDQPRLTFPALGVPVPASEPLEVVTVTVPVSAGNLGTTRLGSTFTARVSDPALGAAPLALSAQVSLNTDVVRSTREGFETFEYEFGNGWASDADFELPWAHHFIPRSGAPNNRVAHGTAAASAGSSWLVTPPLQVGPGPLSLTFRHLYIFEVADGKFWDGGILEVSTDGETFTQVPGSALSPSYDGPLEPGTENPLAGRPAFRGENRTIRTVTVNLGTSYAGRTVWFRWRIGTDATVGAEGWYVDDVTFTGIVGMPFIDHISHRGLCGNRAPRIGGPPDLVVDERTRVVLQPGTVTDPDGDAVTLTWAQTSGAPVTLEGDAFTAPEVMGTETLGFRLTASDGRGGSSTADVTVTVRNVNRAPVADAGMKLTVKAGQRVTLAGHGSDPDGDALSFRWAQVSGAPVTLEGGDTAGPSFTAPPTEVALDLVFRLTVSDGVLDSEAALVEVSVEPAAGCGCASVEPFPALVLVALFLHTRRQRAAHR